MILPQKLLNGTKLYHTTASTCLRYNKLNPYGLFKREQKQHLLKKYYEKYGVKRDKFDIKKHAKLITEAYNNMSPEERKNLEFRSKVLKTIPLPPSAPTLFNVRIWGRTYNPDLSFKDRCKKVGQAYKNLSKEEVENHKAKYKIATDEYLQQYQDWLHSLNPIQIDFVNKYRDQSRQIFSEEISSLNRKDVLRLKHPSEPKPPKKSPYFYFFDDFKHQLEKDQSFQNSPHKVAILSKQCSAAWRNLDEEDKDKYRLKYESAKNEYQKELKKYKAKLKYFKRPFIE